MNALIEYHAVIHLLLELVSIVLIFIIGWKGLATISKYQDEKRIDLDYKNKHDLRVRTDKQLQEISLVISRVHPRFIQFNNDFIEYEERLYKGDLIIEELDKLQFDLDMLKNMHEELQETTFRRYLLNLDFLEKVDYFRFTLSDYLYGHSNVINYVRTKESLPYCPTVKDDYFNEHFVFQEDLTAPIFNLFDVIQRQIRNYIHEK